MSELEDKINQIMNDPDQLGKLSNMAKQLMDGDSGLGDMLSGMFSGGNAEEPGEAKGAPAVDTEMISRLGKLFSAGNSSGSRDKSALVDAMIPYLGDERRRKMEKARQIAKMASIAGIAFREFGGDSDGDV